MDYDDAFGIVIDPARQPKRPAGVYDWEAELKPASYSRLDAGTAGPLKCFMDDVAASWRLGGVLIGEMTILYVVDADGVIHFAVEEAVADGEPGAASRFVRLNVPYLEKLMLKEKKLGHPSLIGCGRARIAGEIKYQPPTEDRESGHWEINADSGRYGRWVEAARRTSAHVDSVIAEFAEHDITLVNAFGY